MNSSLVLTRQNECPMTSTHKSPNSCSTVALDHGRPWARTESAPGQPRRLYGHRIGTGRASPSGLGAHNVNVTPTQNGPGRVRPPSSQGAWRHRRGRYTLLKRPGWRAPAPKPPATLPSRKSRLTLRSRDGAGAIGSVARADLNLGLTDLRPRASPRRDQIEAYAYGLARWRRSQQLQPICSHRAAQRSALSSD